MIRRYLSSLPNTLVAFVLLAGLGLPLAFSGQDEGTYEATQPGFSDPVAWIWCDNSTDDGNGVEYVAFTGNYAHCNASNTVQSTEISRFSSSSHSDPTAFVDWIVSNYLHVTQRSDLTVYKRVVSTVTILP